MTEKELDVYWIIIVEPTVQAIIKAAIAATKRKATRITPRSTIAWEVVTPIAN